MVRYTALIHKYNKKGEKSGWTFVIIPSDIARELKKNNKQSFRVKGKLDNYSFSQTALLPIGEGEFMLPINQTVRKAIKKKHGATVTIQIKEDKSDFVFNQDFIECLNNEPSALQHFKTLPMSHQKYFSKWIDAAKTDLTKVKRITLAIISLSKGFGYAEMIRSQKK